MTRRSFLRRAADRTPATGITVAAHCLAQAGVACRLCDDICAPRAIRFRPQRGGHYFPEVSSDMCTGCLQCLEACPVGALQAGEGPHHAP